MNTKSPILLAGVVILATALAGCTTRTLTLPGGGTYKSTRFGNKETMRRVEYVSPKGERFILEGFAGDQVEGLGVVTEAAARGAVQGLTGQYKLAPRNDASTPQPELERE